MRINPFYFLFVFSFYLNGCSVIFNSEGKQRDADGKEEIDINIEDTNYDIRELDEFLERNDNLENIDISENDFEDEITEECNGIDDDGDTVCDNGFECCKGETRTENCGFCGTRTFLCLNTCKWQDIPDCVNPGECYPGNSEACDSGGGCYGERTCSPTCSWSSCNRRVPPNDTCDGAIDVSSGGSYWGSTCPANDDYASDGTGTDCPTKDYDDADVVYKFYISSRSHIVLRIDQTWPRVYISNACPPQSILSCGPPPVESDLDPGQYYIFVDAWTVYHGAFNITVDITH